MTEGDIPDCIFAASHGKMPKVERKNRKPDLDEAVLDEVHARDYDGPLQRQTKVIDDRAWNMHRGGRALFVGVG